MQIYHTDITKVDTICICAYLHVSVTPCNMWYLILAHGALQQQHASCDSVSAVASTSMTLRCAMHGLLSSLQGLTGWCSTQHTASSASASACYSLSTGPLLCVCVLCVAGLAVAASLVSLILLLFINAASHLCQHLDEPLRDVFDNSARLYDISLCSNAQWPPYSKNTCTVILKQVSPVK